MIQKHGSIENGCTASGQSAEQQGRLAAKTLQMRLCTVVRTHLVAASIFALKHSDSMIFFTFARDHDAAGILAIGEHVLLVL